MLLIMISTLIMRRLVLATSGRPHTPRPGGAARLRIWRGRRRRGRGSTGSGREPTAGPPSYAPTLAAWLPISHLAPNRRSSSLPVTALAPGAAERAALLRGREDERRRSRSRPAITRARACGRIGPLVHWHGRCEQAAEYEAGPLALGTRATPAAQAVPSELGRRSMQRSRRTGPLLSHAKRAALGSCFAARRWRIGRTTRLGQRVNGPSPGEAMLSLAGGEGRR